MEAINILEHNGPYCHAMRTGNLVFCSSQIPLDPDTMALAGSTIEEQTARVIKNLSLVLKEVGLFLENIVKTTVYLKNPEDFEGMNKAYAEMFGGHKPSRTTISTNPSDMFLVQIECVAEAAH